MSEYGCHAYDEVGEICVLDLGYPDCPGAEYRSHLKGRCKEACFHWRPIAETDSGTTPDESCIDVLSGIADKLRQAGASIPAPENKGTVESAMATGLSIALLLVEEAIKSQRGER